MMMGPSALTIWTLMLCGRMFVNLTSKVAVETAPSSSVPTAVKVFHPSTFDVVVQVRV